MKKIILILMVLLFVMSCSVSIDEESGTNTAEKVAVSIDDIITVGWYDDDVGAERSYNVYYCLNTSTNLDEDKVLIGNTSTLSLNFYPYNYFTAMGDYLIGVCGVEGDIEGEIHWSSDETSSTAKTAVFTVDEDLSIWLYTNIYGLYIDKYVTKE